MGCGKSRNSASGHAHWQKDDIAASTATSPPRMMRVPCTKGFAKLQDTPPPLRPLAFQAEALDLSGLGFWQGGCEYDVTGVFVGGNRGFHMILQQFHQRL